LAFVILGSFYLHYFVYSIPVFDSSPTAELSKLEENKSFLIGHHGERPSFYKDTVYLVNFSFHNCTPCQRKKKYLPKIREHFDGKAFKIIEVHIFEKKEVFDEIYMLDYPFVYHDSLNHVNQLFGVSGGPEELLFDKKGRAVRKHVGFSRDEGEQYVKETVLFINELLAE
jgi:thioredoxin-related protein